MPAYEMKFLDLQDVLNGNFADWEKQRHIAKFVDYKKSKEALPDEIKAIEEKFLQKIKEIHDQVGNELREREALKRAHKDFFSKFSDVAVDQETAKTLEAYDSSYKANLIISKKRIGNLFFIVSLYGYALSKPRYIYLHHMDTAIKFHNARAMYYRAEMHLAAKPKNISAARYLYQLANENGDTNYDKIIEQLTKEESQVENKSLVQNSDLLTALDIFQLEVNSKRVYQKNVKLLTEVMNFCISAQNLCKNTDPLADKKTFNAQVSALILKDAKKQFSHRHKIPRMLADIFFVTLGILSLGTAFAAKKHFTGSTLFSNAKTEREKLLDEIISDLQGPKPN